MFLDDFTTVEAKILRAPWHGLDTAKNGVLALLKNVLIPVAQLQVGRNDMSDPSEINGVGYTNVEALTGTSATKNAIFAVDVDGKCLTFSSYGDIEQSLADGIIRPDAIKTAVAKGIDDLLDHVRKMYKNDPEWQAVDKLAYPEAA